MRCPDCDSDQIIKNGFNALDKQIYRCKACGRQFVLGPDKGPISKETKDLIDRLLLERIALAGIARVVGYRNPGFSDMLIKNMRKCHEWFKSKEIIADRSSSSVTKCGRLSGNVRINNGFGSHWIAKAGVLSVLSLAIGVKHPLKDCGIHCLPITVSVGFFIRTFGRLMERFFLLMLMMLLAKKAEKLII